VKDLLASLNESLAARGSVVVAQDGMLIASDVSAGLDLDRLSAMGAAILQRIGASLPQGGLSALERVEVSTEQGKLVLVQAGALFLMVLLGARREVGPDSIEIRSAADRIARQTEFANN